MQSTGLPFGGFAIQVPLRLTVYLFVAWLPTAPVRAGRVGYRCILGR